MKRFCQKIELPDNSELIEKYIEVHKSVWPEIIEGQKEVGILQMQIFGLGQSFFMICDTIDSFDWDRDMSRLAKMPRQAEWEAYVSQFQGFNSDIPSMDKWRLMDKIFDSNQ